MNTFTIHLLALVLTFGSLARGLVIHDDSASTNDRFANSPNFVAAAVNLSGVALNSQNRWLTMISPNVYLATAHLTPGNGSTVTFYATNNPAGPSVTRTVSSTKLRIGTSDLVMGTLDAPLPENYAYYSYATESLPTHPFNWNSYPYKDQTHYHIGRSSRTHPVYQDIAVGQNVLDTRVLDQVVEDPDANGPAVLCTQNVVADTNFVPYETMGQGGDSGGPLLFDNGNASLTLVGIAWYITTVPSTGFSAVGNHAPEIAAFIDQHSLPYQPLAPGEVTWTRSSSNQVSLNWQDISTVETAYVIERADSPDGPWTVIATLDTDTESYLDTEAPSGAIYYRIVAQNSGVDSDPVQLTLLTYSAWAADIAWGGADDSPTGDAGGDGYSNLLAYALSVNPLIPIP
ncbi:MAG: fibronectin type III domain-containing protein, partial [Kiritimatiellae bacterium]|nr:fibronectin type III domain-containing protein [Kiritimatiellia bacterium]